MKKGDKVTQVLPAPIKGEVIGFNLDQEAGKVLVKVQYTDDAGEAHVRDFQQDEVSVDTPASGS